MIFSLNTHHDIPCNILAYSQLFYNAASTAVFVWDELTIMMYEEICLGFWKTWWRYISRYCPNIGLEIPSDTMKKWVMIHCSPAKIWTKYRFDELMRYLRCFRGKLQTLLATRSVYLLFCMFKWPVQVVIKHLASNLDTSHISVCSIIERKARISIHELFFATDWKVFGVKLYKTF